MNKERIKMKSAHKILTLLVVITLISAPIYNTAVYAETESAPVSEPTTEPDSEPTTEPDSNPTTEPDSEPTTKPDSEPTQDPEQTSTPASTSKPESIEEPESKPTEQPEEPAQKLCRERPAESEDAPQIGLPEIDALNDTEQTQDESELKEEDENLPYCDELEEEQKGEKPEDKNHCNCEQQGKGNIDLPIGIDNNYEYGFKDSAKASNSGRGAMPSGISYGSMPSITYASYSSTPAVQPVTYNGSENNYLSTLSVSGYEFKQVFKKERLIYFMTVTNDVESLDVTAYAEESTSSVAISGNSSLKTGINKILIVVTAENGNTKNYKIIVTKEK